VSAVAAKKTTPRRAKKTAPAKPLPCEPCKGSGQVAITVRVGRKRRPVGQQDGICLTCFGTGTGT
jgi:DnaJ-class molecular chaperone